MTTVTEYGCEFIPGWGRPPIYQVYADRVEARAMGRLSHVSVVRRDVVDGVPGPWVEDASPFEHEESDRPWGFLHPPSETQPLTPLWRPGQ